jgi:hypothetical protein
VVARAKITGISQRGLLYILSSAEPKRVKKL